jgi:glycine C-acetyltransferase
LAPPIAAASVRAVDLLTESSHLRDQLRQNTEFFRNGLQQLGFSILEGSHPIIPVMLGDARLAAKMAEELLHKGIYVIGFSFPVVPRGEARIRTQMSAAHTVDQLETALTSFGEIGRSLGVI